MRPSNETHNGESETTAVHAESLQSVDADDFRLWWEQGWAPATTESHSGRWRLTARGRALVGVLAIVGSVLALKVGAPSSGLFAYNDPAKAHPPASETVAASSDAGKPLGNDSAPSTQVKVVKEQLVDPIAQASPAHLPAGESEEVGLIPQAAGGSSTKLVEPKVETSAKTSLSSPPPTQSPDLRPARMASSTPEATKGAAVPPKRAGKLAARVGVATEATTPRGTMETTDELRTPAKPEPAKPDKEARAPQAAQAAAESTAPETASPEAARQPPNPLLQALGDLFGARSSRARQAVDPTPTASTGWAVQLATSKTEAEAKRVLKRLNAKYASALNGSTIRLHKARVSGETVYRLRVAGLSEADAAALCSRLKGDGGICSIVR